MKWKHFPRYWPFVRGIHRTPLNSPHKGQWRGALMFSLICTWIYGWVNNGKADDLRRHRAHYDVTVMTCLVVSWQWWEGNRIIALSLSARRHTPLSMMTPWNENIFRVTGHLCGEFTGPRWIPHAKASDAELWCFLWSAPEYTVE